MRDVCFRMRSDFRNGPLPESTRQGFVDFFNLYSLGIEVIAEPIKHVDVL